MFLFVFGMPGGFADWCDAVAAEMARRRLGSAELIRADTLEQLARSVIETGASHAVVSSRQPGGRLRASLAEHRRRLVIALDDPAVALGELVLDHGVGFVDAVRAVAGSCATLLARRPEPGALILQRAHDWLQPAATVAAIADHFHLPVSSDELDQLAASAPAAQAPRSDIAAWWDDLPPADRDLATGALLPLVDRLGEGTPPPIVWTHPLFFVGEGASEPVNGPVDITGRAHCVLSGPYIALPPGGWSLSLTMQFSRTAAEHEFLVEVCTDRPVASGTIRPEREGVAMLGIDFALAELTERPVALRVSSQRAAFDGAISVETATLVPADAAEEGEGVALVSFDE